ncbi:MAG TPA: DMT family transporter [Solirubrobacteraceae bacterium]|jgi:drug/metabolite transporter (DMT)-like permease|nr:DMT family transporter [Solirubrobacteraceae bacterium]
MLAVLGGLGAAFAWAISTLCSSRSSRMMEPIAVVGLIMVVGLVITAPLAAVQGVPSFDAESVTWLVISGAGNVGGLVLTYKALRIGQVALVAPLVSTEGAIAATISLLAGESLAPGVGVALALVALGVCLSSVPESAKTERRLVHDQPASVLYAIAAALVFGTSLYATGRAAATLPSTWVVLSARLIGTLALALPLAVTGRLNVVRRAIPLVVVAGVCEVLGFYSYTAGARHGIAVAAVLASQFATIAAVVAYFLFKERLNRIQLAGVSSVIVGVALLSALRA